MSKFYQVLLGSGFSVQDVTDAAALSSVTGVSLVFVESFKCYWNKNVSSTLTPDGVTVIAAAGGGNWERMVETTSPQWLKTAAWYVNSVSGNDENAGGVGAPLKTFDELARRIHLRRGPLRQDTTVTVSADSVLDHCRFDIDGDKYKLTISGVATIQLSTTINTYADRNHATPVAPQLTLTGVADMSAYTGMFCRVTATAAGAWIGKNNPAGAGASIARTPRFSSITGVATTPANGSAVTVESFPTIGNVEAHFRSTNLDSQTLVIERFKIGAVGVIGSGSFAYFRDCCYDGGAGPSINARARSNRGERVLSTSWSTRCMAIGSHSHAVSGMATIANLFHVQTQSWARNEQFGSSGFFSIALVENGAGIEIRGTFASLPGTQVFDAPIAVQLPRHWCHTNTTTGLSGSNNGVGLQVGLPADGFCSNCNFMWTTTGNKPNLLGTTAAIRIEGSTDQLLAWADTPYYADEQRGVSAALSSGVRTVTARNALLRGVVTTPATGAGTTRGLRLEAVESLRTATQFQIKAVSSTGATQTTDTSTADWHIPAAKRGVRIAQRDSLV